MGVLALINLLALIMLFPQVMRMLKDYRQQLQKGKEEPVFNIAEYKDLDIDPKAWSSKS